MEPRNPGQTPKGRNGMPTTNSREGTGRATYDNCAAFVDGCFPTGWKPTLMSGPCSVSTN